MSTPRGPRRPYRKHRERPPEHDRPGLQLQPRDFEILQSLHTNRFLTFGLLLSLFPPDPSRTPAHVRTDRPKAAGSNLARRLQKLFAHELVDRLRLVTGGELIYALAQPGLELLQSRQADLFSPSNLHQLNREAKSVSIEHTLMEARLRVALVVASREAQRVKLEHFEREGPALHAAWERAGIGRCYINPDARFCLSEDGKVLHFLVECDRGSMGLPRLRFKLRNLAYFYEDRQHQRAFGIPGFRVLTITQSAQRASNLLDLVATDDAISPRLKQMFLFTTERAYREQPSNLFSAIWRAGDNPDQRSAIVGSPLPRR
ncbi:MAG: replication-relaxation family protein [Candidatus Binataceae bacterium]